MNRFQVLKDFEDGTSQYCRGLKYTIRKGNTVLADKAKAWVKEGKIKFVDAIGAAAKGKGEVK